MRLTALLRSSVSSQAFKVRWIERFYEQHGDSVEKRIRVSRRH